MDINSIKAKLSALQTQQSRPSGEARKNVFWKPAVASKQFVLYLLRTTNQILSRNYSSIT